MIFESVLKSVTVGLLAFSSNLDEIKYDGKLSSMGDCNPCIGKEYCEVQWYDNKIVTGYTETKETDFWNGHIRITTEHWSFPSTWKDKQCPVMTYCGVEEKHETYTLVRRTLDTLHLMNAVYGMYHLVNTFYDYSVSSSHSSTEFSSKVN